MDEDADENFAIADLERRFGRNLALSDIQNKAEGGIDDEISDDYSETSLGGASTLSLPSESIYNVEFGGTALIAATRANDIHQMATILRYPGHIDQADNYGNTALHYAAISGFMDGVNLLIKYRCGLNPQNIIGLSPLMEAIFNRHIDVAKRLLEAGASPFILSSSLESAITHAASMNYLELLYYMINVQTEPAMRKQVFDHALVYAAKNRNVVLADALLSKGAEVNLTIPHHVPLLIISVGLGDDILVTRWIHAGANVEGRDFLGLTPLMHAAISGHLNTCQLLISYGANSKAVFEGKTARDMALERGYKAVAQYLQSDMLGS